MKILFIINNLGVGGAERLVVDEVNEMYNRGIDFLLLTLKLEKGDKTLSGQLRIPKEKWVKINFGSLLNVSSWFKVIFFIRKAKPDILITHLWYSNTIGKIAGTLCGAKKIITFEHNVYDTLKTWKMFFLDRLLQNLSTHIIAVSMAVKTSLVRHGIREERIKVILNGIDISKYQNRYVKNENNKFTFIFIGRLIRQKGVDILLKAFSKTKGSELFIVGTGAEEANFKRLTGELNVKDRVHFLGTRQDIPDLLLRSDCFVLPSRYEGLPMVLLEAVAAEKLIIVSDFQSASEVIKNGHNGLIVKKEDVESLFEAMRRLQQDDNLVRILKKQVSKDAKKFSIRIHVDQMLDLAY